MGTYSERVIGYEFGPVVISTITTVTVGTIDGTDLRGITQNYSADVEIHAVRYGGATGYTGTATNTASAERGTGDVLCHNGTAVLLGNGIANVSLDDSGTDILVKLSTNQNGAMSHFVWLVFRVAGDVA